MVLAHGFVHVTSMERPIKASSWACVRGGSKCDIIIITITINIIRFFLLLFILFIFISSVRISDLLKV